ncbi:MAG: CxxC-x17-CxxC domain-containing protein [Minisyncoccia bacterium]|jgi:CxxC-x17-CxxC domain-containing protein
MEEAPEKNVIYFARTDFRNQDRLFGIKRTDRRQHMYMIGKTGTGKSALLNNLIVQDIANGEGLCVVDPHGELVEGIMKKIPEERMKDVIYFNPADPDFHIGFNVLELPDPKYKHLVASGLMGIFTKIWAGVWSPRMEYILNNCVLALLDTPGSTLLGIPRLLTDKDYRQKVIANITDPVVKAFWIHEFEAWQDKFRNEAIAPIQNKVGQFLSTSLIRNIVGQSKSTIDIFDVMNEGKIFLVNVSKGRIGEDNSALLGAMLITKIQLSAMERVRIPEDERVDFYLYVDEFQNFATDSFAGILSEARKYRLDLILAHQYVGQLVTDNSTKIRDAIFGNVGTMIVFRVGAGDAEFLENEFLPEFVIQDIVNLPNYRIYLKLMVDGVTARPFSAMTLPPLNVETSAMVESEIIKISQKRYSRPREVVEEEINRWSGVMGVGAGGNSVSAGGVAGMGMGAGSGSGAKYEVICSSCGKTTTVPFEPTPGRPIYCRDCLKKIEAGELQPVRMPRIPSARRGTQKKYSEDLGRLGIEFPEAQAGGEEAPQRIVPPARRFVVQQSAVVGPKIAPSAPTASVVPAVPVASTIPTTQQETDTTPPAGPTLPLSALKPMERTVKTKRPQQKEEINISELREAIKASLKADITADAEPPPPDASEKNEDEDDDDNKEHLAHR